MMTAAAAAAAAADCVEDRRIEVTTVKKEEDSIRLFHLVFRLRPQVRRPRPMLKSTMVERKLIIVRPKERVRC